jgi:hypothetical protein
MRKQGKHVVECNTFLLGLTGTVSPDIAKLTDLSVLLLSENNLSGPLPLDAFSAVNK